MISTLKRIQAKKAAQENNGGFTLIELLIVIVVLGILAAVVVFSLGGVTGSSAVAACQADGATVNTALAAFSAQNNGSAATATSQLVNSGTVTTNALQAWPSNFTHYTFALDSTGSLWVIAGSTQVKTLPTTGNGWTKWTGSASCATAKVK